MSPLATLPDKGFALQCAVTCMAEARSNNTAIKPGTCFGNSEDMTSLWLLCQDLSMGWLHCEPEELFIPKLFGTSDFTAYIPRGIAWLFSPATAFLQAIADRFNVGDLSALTFIARPIQVHQLKLIAKLQQAHELRCSYRRKIRSE